jgi:thiosulfate/3-mercaptopyruvate sulfurtransferase
LTEDQVRRCRSGMGADSPMSVLMEVAELARVLDSGRAPVLADVRWALAGPPGLPQFEAGHLPGAHWVDLEHELSAAPGAGGRHPLPDPSVFQQAMRRIGVRSNSTVVAYDGGDATAAARLWWMLIDAGHRSVRVLNGGIAAWEAAGLPLQSGPGDAIEPGDFVAEPGHCRQVTAAEVRTMLGRAGGRVLVDVRAAERYAGEVEPIDPVAGHIPGAINLPSVANVGPDGSFLPVAALAARFAPVGEAPIVYCGSGITAAHTVLAMTVAGHQNVALYPGSWSDWITDPTSPIATGSVP